MRLASTNLISMNVSPRKATASDDRWAAVQTRDRRADGSFVYGVHSTKIYCRPSCPARRPRQSGVSFFPDARRALDAGYRACRRCQPDVHRSSDKDQAIAAVCEAIDRGDAEPFALTALANRLGFSSGYLTRAFKTVVGMTPKQYASMRRIERFKERMQSGGSVTSALYDSGFGSASRLYENGAAYLGMSPAAYRRGGDGATVFFTIVRTAIGHMLVARTKAGVCSVKLGASDAALQQDLKSEFRAAAIRRDDGRPAEIVRAILAHLQSSAPLPDLPKDVVATAFQRKVWKALAAIPYGGTRTYGEIARSIGLPSAGRAVAQACASNRLAIIVPCHRAVPRSGGAGGYRWGSQRKKLLLKLERQRTKP
ncbi:MAG: bifunctional DNA-binding transcriptional regulator/O6-methylguanine-DNA methyltransferase Ada [Candidatus Eremiobacter antarcticus]|nr:bifunctional DNA-binding transcriptional regulator/O6-methylguanine-DNA methyltransferase Ada [Candidatus Eremiobacteraeota bacterium]